MIGFVTAGALWAVMACRAGQPYDLCRTMIAITQVESDGCKNLVGDHGKSLGCAQVSMPAAKAVGVSVTRHQLLENAPLNLVIGAAYLARCIVLMGTWERGLVCYNAGEKTAIRLTWWQVEHFPYVEKVRRCLPAKAPRETFELVSWPAWIHPYQITPEGLIADTGVPGDLKRPPSMWRNQKTWVHPGAD